MPRHVKFLLVGGAVAFVIVGTVAVRQASPAAQAQPAAAGFDATINQNAQRLLEEGRRIFRHDTFGSEDFWGGKLELQFQSDVPESRVRTFGLDLERPLRPRPRAGHSDDRELPFGLDLATHAEFW